MPKRRKDFSEKKSYLTISLVPTISKALLKLHKSILKERKLIP